MSDRASPVLCHLGKDRRALALRAGTASRFVSGVEMRDVDQPTGDVRATTTIAFPPGSTPARRSSNARRPSIGKPSRRRAPASARNRRVCVVRRTTRSVPLTRPFLQLDSANDGLRIPRRRLGLHAVPPAIALHDGVPRPSVAGDRQGYFDGPAQGSVEAAPEVEEQGDVGGVPDGLARRIGPQRQLESNDRMEACEVVRGNPGDQSALDLADLRHRQARRLADQRKAESSVHPRLPDVVTGAPDEIGCTPRTKIDLSKPGCHGSSVAARAHPRLIYATIGPRRAHRSSVSPIGGESAPEWESTSATRRNRPVIQSRYQGAQVCAPGRPGAPSWNAA
jgi:hypothetical protein